MKLLSIFKASKVHLCVYFLSVCIALFSTDTFSNTDVPGISTIASGDICKTALSDLSQFLTPVPPRIKEQTVFYKEITSEGTVVLTKAKDSVWHSQYVLIKGGYTNQGDPRFPIFLFGDKLSLQLGFKIYQDGNETIFNAPGAQKLGAIIKKANAILKSLGQEPITYLPTEAGFLSHEEALKLALNTDGEILLNFPYADKNPQLAPHEIAYHLGAILYPRKFLARAQMINRHTLNFIEYLKSRQSELGGIATVVAEQLLLERSYELDAGTANLQALLGSLRSKKQGLSYRMLWFDLSHNDTLVNTHRVDIDFLSRPSMTPLEALMVRLFYMTNIIATPFGQGHMDYPRWSYELYGYGKTIELSDAEYKTLKSIMKDYVRLHKDDDGDVEIKNSKDWMREFVSGLDKRIEQISRAIEESKKK